MFNLMGKEFIVNKTVIILLLIFGISILFIINDYTGYVYYPGGQWGGFGQGFGILDLYYEYSEWFDFFIFLAIFLGLAKTVFEESFDAGGKALYTGLGVLLALGLVLWERNTGNNIMELFGGYAFLIIVLGLLFFVFQWVLAASGIPVIAVGVVLILFFIFFKQLFQEAILDPMGMLLPYSTGRFIEALANMVPIVGVGLLIWGLIKMMKGK